MFTVGRLTVGRLLAAFGNRVTDTQPGAATTTSTTYTDTLTGGDVAAVAFVAPLSGKVDVINAAQIAPSAGHAFCAFELRTGDSIGGGDLVEAPDDAEALICHTSGTLIRSDITTPIDGLTPGADYHVFQVFKIDTTGSLETRRRRITVRPTA
jgi:hypothetical protein